MSNMDKLYYGFMSVAVAVITALSVSIIHGCVAKPAKVYPEVSTHITCIPRADQALDPCELEFWENQQFDKREGW